MINFNELPWHDARLQSVYINRNNPGENDSITLKINWPESNIDCSIEFFDCYFLEANMNFGIVASESILSANYYQNSEKLDTIRNNWISFSVNLEDLTCFEFITNSTNSTIRIYSMGYRFIESSNTPRLN